ncbi:GNAT family N-acetyltransferase, partial [Vibrio cholerae O1]|nr:GNAT family N-acetyltransferase [Vibrio cholerae O1]
TASARGRGLASSALRTLVDVAHDELDVYRLELGYRVNNPASAAVARAAGFLVEGREREKLLYDGVRFDTEVCARLSGDP